MNYTETVNYLFSQLPMFEKQGTTGFNEGLRNTLALDEYFDHPHRQYLTIHVAGTNGKGSCSHSLAAILQAAGYRVGLYTSPHLVSFRERIRVDGEMIPEDYVVDFVAENRPFYEPLRPSFFELTTAMAFKFFADMGVDVAVIEVGLGGRLDCTNIISPILSVITSIGLDHTAILGDTLAQIAREKAGIIKLGVPVVAGKMDAEALAVVEAKAAEENAPLHYAPLYNAPDVDGDLEGDYQTLNRRTVLCAWDALCRHTALFDGLDAKAVLAKGLAGVKRLTGLAGRWQTLQSCPKVICDVGHNPQAWQQLHRQIEALPHPRKHLIIGMMADKDVSTVLELMRIPGALYHFCAADSPRALPAAELADKAKTAGLLPTDHYATVWEAYQDVLRRADKDDLVFVGGSCYVVGELLAHLQ